MTFKLYDDKSSVLKKNTRYVQGGETDVFPKFLGWWEKREDIAIDQIDDIEFYITPQYDKRPDKVSFLFYGRPDISWLILQYNNIVDINEQFKTGLTIRAPSPMRVFANILTRPIRYQQQ